MTRVVGRIGLVAVALALFATSMANAAPLGFAPDPTAIMDGSGSGERVLFTGTGFEPGDTPGYALGSIQDVNGWRCFGNATAYPLGPRCGGTPTGGTAPPLLLPNGELAGVVAKGRGSPQGLFVTNAGNYPANTNVGYFSPKFKDFTADNTVNWDMKIDDAGFAASYQVVVQAPLEGFVNTRLLFYYNNYLYVLDSPDGGTTVVFNTAGTWTGGGQDTWLTYQLAMDFTARTFTISTGPDKNNLTLLYQSTWLFATTAEEVLFFESNNNLGTPATGDPRGAGMYIDNVEIKPEPGTLAMLGAGLLLALRRRKA